MVVISIASPSTLDDFEKWRGRGGELRMSMNVMSLPFSMAGSSTVFGQATYWIVTASGALLTLPKESATEMEMVLVKTTSTEPAEDTDGE